MSAASNCCSSSAPSWVIAVRIASSTGRHARAGAQRVGGQRGQPLYLGRERRGDLVAEPPFSSPVAAGGAVAAGFGGRASQISSFTATICSLTSAKRW